jgi:hypothetical protein
MFVGSLDESDLSINWMTDVDDALNVEWATGKDIDIDSEGRILVTGQFEGQQIQISSGNMTVFNEGNNNAVSTWIASFNGSNVTSLATVRSQSGSENCHPNSLRSGSSSSYVVGVFKDDLYLEPGDPLSHPGSPPVESMYAIRLGSVYGSIDELQFYKATEEQPVSENPDHGVTIRAYPNPTSEMLTLELSKKFEEVAEITVLDVSGRVIEKQVWNGELGTTFNLDLGGMIGTFIVRVSVNDEIWRIPVVKI